MGVMSFYSIRQEELLAEIVAVKLLFNSVQGIQFPIMKEYIA